MLFKFNKFTQIVDIEFPQRVYTIVGRMLDVDKDNKPVYLYRCNDSGAMHCTSAETIHEYYKEADE